MKTRPQQTASAAFSRQHLQRQLISSSRHLPCLFLRAIDLFARHGHGVAFVDTAAQAISPNQPSNVSVQGLEENSTKEKTSYVLALDVFRYVRGRWVSPRRKSLLLRQKIMRPRTPVAAKRKTIPNQRRNSSPCKHKEKFSDQRHVDRPSWERLETRR